MSSDDCLFDDEFDISILNNDNDNKSINSDETIVTPCANNPVQENLIKQLHFACNQIDQTNINVEIVEKLTENVLKSLATKCAYSESSSDSDDDLYTETGELVIKKHKNKLYERQKLLAIVDVWQRLIDDKWIIGVIVENTSSCSLKDPTIYMCPKNRDDNYHGTSIFWTLIDKYWYPTEDIQGGEQVIATTVIDLPSFNSETYIEAHGTIICGFNDKLVQTTVPVIRLTVQDTIDGTCSIQLDDEDIAYQSIISLKSMSIDRPILIPAQPGSKVGEKLNKFLEKYEFKEVSNVCIARNAGSLQYCLFEILLVEDNEVRILISARSEAQLSAIINLLRIAVPKLIDVEKDQALDEAAEALQDELKLYLTCDDPVKLQHARIKTDLLIP